MRNRLRFTLIITLALFVYASLIVAIVFVVNDSKDRFQAKENEYINQAQKALNQALLSTNYQEELNAVMEQFPMELIVMYQDQVVFQTLELGKGQSLKGVLNQSVITVESQGMFDRYNEQWFVWYSLYHMPSYHFFSELLTIQNYLIISAFMIVLAIVLFLQYYLLKPLMSLKKTLKQLNQYQFDNIVSFDDTINLELNQFAHHMNQSIQQVSLENTQLEVDLNTERNQLENVIVFSKALVHNLKTPLHQTLLENEFQLSQMEQPSKEVKALIDYNVSRTDYVLKEVNKVLAYLSGDVYSNKYDQEEVDLVKVIRECVHLLYPSIDKKEISLNIITPDQFMIRINPMVMSMLIHNLVSNMILYATINSEVTIDLEETNQFVTLQFINESTKDNIQRLNASEEILKIITNKDNQYSTGKGLNLTKNLITLLGGSYTNEVEGNVVTITISFEVTK